MGCQKYGESTERGLGRSGVKFYHVRMILGKTHSPPAAFHFSEPRLLPGSRRRAGSEFPKSSSTWQFGTFWNGVLLEQLKESGAGSWKGSRGLLLCEGLS